jgi:hypothetical protein
MQKILFFKKPLKKFRKLLRYADKSDIINIQTAKRSG